MKVSVWSRLKLRNRWSLYIYLFFFSTSITLYIREPLHDVSLTMTVCFFLFLFVPTKVTSLSILTKCQETHRKRCKDVSATPYHQKKKATMQAATGVLLLWESDKDGGGVGGVLCLNFR